MGSICGRMFSVVDIKCHLLDLKLYSPISFRTNNETFMLGGNSTDTELPKSK